MDLAVMLGASAGAVYALGYVLYLRKTLAGGNRPNPASWFLWVFLTVLNCVSYLSLSGDAVKAVIPVVSSFFCLAIFLFALAKGRFTRIDAADGAALALGIVAAGAWWSLRSPVAANLLMQGCLAVSFVPTLRGVWRDPSVEKAAPWLAWSAGYVLTFCVIALRWRGQPQDLIYPVNCLFLHGGVGVLALRRRAAS